MAIELQNITNADLKFLYECLQSRPTEVNISHKTMPSYRAHSVYVKYMPHYIWHIIWIDNTRVGQVYMTEDDYIGIQIVPEFQRKGIGSKVVKLLKDRYARKKYYANIAIKNSPLKKFWKKNGFKPLQVTFETST